MNENRYSPPTSRVADLAASPVDSTAVSALSMATRLVWISLAIGVVNSALQWKYLISAAPRGVVIGTLVFTFAVLALLTYYIGRGKNWARIVFLILAIIGLPTLLQLPAVFSRDVLVGLLNLLQSLLQFVALYIVFFTSARRAFGKRGTAEQAV